MRALPALLLFLSLTAVPAGAQDRSARLNLVVAPGDTGKAVVSALEYLQKITPDSIVLAGCSVSSHGSATARMVTVGSSHIQLPAAGSARSLCRPGAVRQAEGVLVIIEGVRQIDRDVILPYGDRINFEVRLQVQYGMSMREWHSLMVRPDGAIPGDTGMTARGWRVARWEITAFRTH